MQFGRFEQLDAFGQFAAEVSARVFQHFFRNFARLGLNGVEHGGVANNRGYTSFSYVLLR